MWFCVLFLLQFFWKLSAKCSASTLGYQNVLVQCSGLLTGVPNQDGMERLWVKIYLAVCEKYPAVFFRNRQLQHAGCAAQTKICQQLGKQLSRSQQQQTIPERKKTKPKPKPQNTHQESNCLVFEKALFRSWVKLKELMWQSHQFFVTHKTCSPHIGAYPHPQRSLFCELQRKAGTNI